MKKSFLKNFFLTLLILCSSLSSSACSSQEILPNNSNFINPYSSVDFTSSEIFYGSLPNFPLPSLEMSSISVNGINEYIHDKTIVTMEMDIDDDGINESFQYDPYKHGLFTEKNAIVINFLDFSGEDINMGMNATGFGYIDKGYRFLTDQTGQIYLGIFDGILHTDIPDIISVHWENIFFWNGVDWKYFDRISYTKVVDEEGTHYQSITHKDLTINNIEDLLNLYSPIEDKTYYITY